MSTTTDQLPFQQVRFSVAPHAELVRLGHVIRWPIGGVPVALDPAAAALHDCFTEPATPLEVADDLAETLGLDPGAALAATVRTVQALRQSGHVIAEGQIPMLAEGLAYPSGASP